MKTETQRQETTMSSQAYRGFQTIEAAEEAWWTWHDSDSSRLRETVEDGEYAARAWATGESDDGPDTTGETAGEVTATVHPED